jgi:two-component system LytT family response regulator
VIFCTAHSEHAVRAFDVGAVDYLLKPIEAGRLQRALERARSRDAVKRDARPRPELARLAVPTRDGIVLIDPEVISHAVLDGELVTLFTAHGKYLTDFALQELQDKLPASKFERVHRRALLNLEAVARLTPNGVGGFTAYTHRGDTVEVSRAAARLLRRKLGLRQP